MIKVFDIETCGLEPPAGVCEIACAMLLPSAEGWQVDPRANAWLTNPGQPIPPETSAIHHIVDEDVADAIPFEDAASALFDPMLWRGETIIAAHNASFERRWLTPEVTGPLRWICSYKAALRLWADAPSHSNQALRYWRRPVGLDRNIASVAHRAFPDAYVTAFLLRDMLNDGASIDDMIRWTEEPALQIRCGFGKHRGKRWTEVDTGFLEWVAGKDFDEDVLFTVNHEMKRRDAAARKD